MNINKRFEINIYLNYLHKTCQLIRYANILMNAWRICWIRHFFFKYGQAVIPRGIQTKVNDFIIKII